MDEIKLVGLDDKGRLYQMADNKLRGYTCDQNTGFEEEVLTSLQNNPYQTFFKTPFHAISYVIDNKVIETFSSHPSSFYPGSPFDVFEAIRIYLRDTRLIIPRFYLYPSSRCNAHCPICQFNFRRESPSYLRWDIIKKVLDYMAFQNPKPKLLSAIISGDGEPTLHPDFIRILDYCSEKGIHVFLTSNWMLIQRKSDMIINAVAKHVDMLTISLKGLNSKAYHHYQGIKSSKNIFDKVLNNLEILLERVDKIGRRKNILIGIASLILPENTNSYQEMIEYLVAHKLDYIYLNVVEPTYDHWGITFTEAEKKQTMEVFECIKAYQKCGTLIRYPANPFKTRYNNTVYYDAEKRIVKPLCGSALWNPLVIPKSNRDGILLSCRSSEKFKETQFWYSDNIADTDFQDILSQSVISKIMSATKDCHQCRLERQVSLFDRLLKLEIENDLKGSFILTFDMNKLQPNGAITFEETF
jgi:MoaA/NifB/PqqE/SkfB family radical SAM enzyme